jgi:hypothetical protein
MTKPMRAFLLNEQISAEARKIAHKWIDTCRGEDLPNHSDHHTKSCNQLKAEIEQLCLQIKLAREQTAPQFYETGEGRMLGDIP